MFSINVPFPAFDDKTVQEIKKLLKSYEEAAAEGPVRGGVIVEGEAADYALVWEWGNARQTQKGPKTTLGTNPDGKQVWLTIQAPFGYIRINEGKYINIIETELDKLDFSEAEDGEDIRALLETAAFKASNQIAKVIADAAPYDTGQLRDSIQPADPKDPDLKKIEDELELGSDEFSHELNKP